MASLAPATILYVDDEEGSRLAFSHLFRKEGYEVREAATGGEALRLVAEKPDLVVLDVNLPDINGFEVCRRIKAHPATRSIPVLHMSGVFTSTEDKSHGLEGGADGYLAKPVEPREVMATVRALLRVHRAEEAARTAALQWQATFDAISDALCLIDPAGKVLRCNQAMANLLGKPARGLIGQSYAPLCKERLEGPDLLLLERVRETGGGASAELPHAGRWFRIEVDPVLDEQGTFLGSVHLFIDLTERKQLEEQLRQAQKMEAIGRLAGGVAHDFNNLLTGITGNVALLLAQTPPSDPRHELLLPVDKAAWRAAELTRQLLGFSRRTLLWLKPTNLNHALDEVVGLLARTLDPQITLTVSSPTDLWTVQADPGQINQVLLNLCLNARDAMPEGGRLMLETANMNVELGKTSVHADARPGEFVRLRVADTGHGIPEELRSSVFEPFFTTKPAGQGTGLGLAMVFGMVKQHHGWIECHSEVDRGTRFDIYLPRFIATDEPEGQPAETTTAPHGSETILVADDESMLRQLGKRVLEQHGYEVLLAEDGEHAIEMYRRHAEQIDLVILDLSMPGMSGRDTLRHLVQVNPAVRVLMASGYSAEQVQDLSQANVVGFVRKPYAVQELAHTVRNALNHGNTAPAAADERDTA